MNIGTQFDLEIIHCVTVLSCSAGDFTGSRSRPIHYLQSIHAIFLFQIAAQYAGPRFGNENYSMTTNYGLPIFVVLQNAHLSSIILEEKKMVGWMDLVIYHLRN